MADGAGRPVASRIVGALLERDQVLAAQARLIDSACAGAGGCLILEATAGLGKTAVLVRAADHARAAGATVLQARGGELEQDLPWGVVRDLLARAARTCAVGPAGAAALGTGPSAAGDDLAALHALTELCADLADAGPVVLCVDDAHWADPSSARWLAYAAPRLAQLGVALIVAARPVDARRPPALDVLAAQDHVTVATLEPLTPAGAARVVRTHRPDADEALCTACNEAAGGNPFLLTALAEELGHLDVAEPSRIAGLAIDRVDRVVARRLGAAGSDAAALAGALAVLGGSTTLGTAAALATVSDRAARSASDALRAVGLLDDGLDFAHPLLRAAVERSLTPGRLSTTHLEAARILDRTAPVERVGAHLLNVDPGNDPWVRERLVVAGDAAVGADDPRSAVTLFERALAERCGPPSCELLTRVGRAALVVDPSAAAEHLSSALELADVPELRVALALDLAVALQGSRRWAEAVTLLESLGSDLRATGAPRALWLRVQVELMSQAFFDADSRHRRTAWLTAAAEVATGDSDDELGVHLHRAIEEVGSGTAERGRILARRAWADGRLFGGRLRESPSLWWVVYVGLYCDDYDLAEAAVARGLTDARRRGSATATAYVNTQHAELLHRLGRLDEAAAAAQTAAVICAELGPDFWCYWITLAARVQSSVARGVPADGLALLAELDLLHGPLPEVMSNPLLPAARASARIAAGDAATGVTELREVKAWTVAQETPSPGGWLWPAALVDGLIALGDRGGAIEEAEEWLADTERFGSALTRGMARRALGLASGDLLALEQAVEILAGTPCRAEHARALLEHGAALRRANRRREAREPLRSALDLATRADAAEIAERAGRELAATGARPRRVLLDGIDALTASELRVARLAADGLSNPEIAAAQFVTRKTVEKHLANVYLKLGASSRRDLPALLD